jgi:hypothetical protein
MVTEFQPIQSIDGDETLHHISEGIAGATGEEFFRSLAQHLANAFRSATHSLRNAPTICRRECARSPSATGVVLREISNFR